MRKSILIDEESSETVSIIVVSNFYVVFTNQQIEATTNECCCRYKFNINFTEIKHNNYNIDIIIVSIDCVGM